MRFNDGKVSPQGTLLVGRMHSKWRDGQRGRLYRLDPGSRRAASARRPCPAARRRRQLPLCLPLRQRASHALSCFSV